MANSVSKNVIKVDTTASFTGQKFIRSIKYIGASTSSAIITDTASGNRVWEDSSSTTNHNADVCINATEGITVTISGTAVVYIYLE